MILSRVVRVLIPLKSTRIPIRLKTWVVLLVVKQIFWLWARMRRRKRRYRSLSLRPLTQWTMRRMMSRRPLSLRIRMGQPLIWRMPRVFIRWKVGMVWISWPVVRARTRLNRLVVMMRLRLQRRVTRIRIRWTVERARRMFWSYRLERILLGTMPS